MPPTNRSTLFWGSLLVLLGLFLLLKNLGLVPANLLPWWPLLVIGAGLLLLAQAASHRRGGGMVGGLMLVAMGSYWLLNNLGRMDDRFFVPIVLISLGAGLMLRWLVEA